MGEKTEIAWTDHTFNPWVGCTKISPACANCYASVDTFARRSRAKGLELWGTDAARHVTSAEYWKQPARWNKAAAKAGERRKVFCASLSDVFEDRPDLLVPRARLAQLVAQTPNLDWLLLTKRPENADRLWRAAWGGALLPDGAQPWLPNVWLGTTVEDQRRAAERIPHLLAVPAAVRFLSCEPLLEAVDLTDIPANAPPLPGCTGMWDYFSALDGRGFEAQSGDRSAAPECPHVDWVIVGGESGTKARPMHPQWARSIRDQCKAAGVPFLFKQWGEWAPTGPVAGGPLGGDMRRDVVQIVKVDGAKADGRFGKGDVLMRRVGKHAAGRLLDGVLHDAFPAPPTEAQP